MRRILMTTDGSDNALKAASYLADLYGKTRDLEITVLSIYPAVPPLYREEHLNPAVRKNFAAWLKKREGDAQRFIEEAAEFWRGEGSSKAKSRPGMPGRSWGVPATSSGKWTRRNSKPE